MAFREEMKQPRLFTGQWNNMSVFTVNKPELRALLEKDIETLGREQYKDPVDCFFDLALQDELQMQFLYEFGQVNKDMITHPHTLWGYRMAARMPTCAVRRGTRRICSERSCVTSRCCRWKKQSDA
jgi:N-acyl-D-aspartate/D-glutamate deacylase